MSGGCVQPAFADLANCVRCERLADALREVRAEHPGYHARPVAAFGDDAPRLLIVGLAPGMHGANRSGRPFTGDYAASFSVAHFLKDMELARAEAHSLGLDPRGLEAAIAQFRRLAAEFGDDKGIQSIAWLYR